MLFAGAVVSVIIMASCLEAAKLIAASFLYQYWKTINNVLKFYLIIAVVILAGITSLGIYGFLSNAYQQTKIAYNLSKTVVDSLSTQKSSYEFRVKNLQQQVDFKKGQLQSFTNSSANRDNLLTTLASQNKSVGSVERNAARTQKEISKINIEISALMDNIRPLQDSVFYYDVAIKKASLSTSQKSELGPLEYLSGILNVEMDKIVNWFILLFVIVFDPLAMALLISFNFLSNKPKLEEIKIELEEVKEQVQEIKEEKPLQDNPKKNLINDPIIVNEVPEIIQEIFTQSIQLVEPELLITQSIQPEVIIEQNILLDERIELLKEDINTISDEQKPDVIQKDTPVIEYIPLTGDSIYEESNELKAEKQKAQQNKSLNIKPGLSKRIGYIGGVS